MQNQGFRKMAVMLFNPTQCIAYLWGLGRGAGVPPLRGGTAPQHPLVLMDLPENKIPMFEREGWQNQPSLSNIGILLIRRSLSRMITAIKPRKLQKNWILCGFLR